MTRSLEGKTVVVSGAAGGVGRAAVSLFIENGARVCATDLNPAVAELERDSPGHVVAVAADVTKAADVEKIFTTAEQRLGPVDVLISNAGFIISKSAHDTSEDEWDRVMNANAKSFFLMSRRALPSMLARGHGSIVATGSISSVVGLPEQAAYCAAKGALLQLVRQMAVDYASRGIRVNAVGSRVDQYAVPDSLPRRPGRSSRWRGRHQERPSHWPLGRAPRNRRCHRLSGWSERFFRDRAYFDGRRRLQRTLTATGRNKDRTVIPLPSRQVADNNLTLLICRTGRAFR